VTATAGRLAAPPDFSRPLRLPSRRSVVITAAVTGTIWLGVLLGRLFIGGAVGMGDQGDGRRLMCQLGVRSTVPFGASTSDYLSPTWVTHQWYGEACSADGSGGVFRSSELWLLSLTKHLTPILGFPGALDLRVLGIICAVLVGLVVAALVIMLPGSLVFRVVIASLVGLLAADSAVAQFFISPYSEPAELIGTLALCAALLALWRRGHTTWASLAAVAFLSAVVIGAKTQAAALLPALIVALLWLPHGWKRDELPRRTLTPRLRWLFNRLPGLVVSLLLVIVTGFFVITAPVGLSQQDVYAEVFGEILIHSPNPAADLASLGADPGLASAVGSSPESPNTATIRPAYLQFRQEVTQAKILEFYATHPTRLISVASDGLRGMHQWRQEYLGSYLPNSGEPPGAIEDRIGVYGFLFQQSPEAFLVLGWLATLLVGLSTARRRTLRPAERAVGRLAVFVAIASFCEFWAVMISVGFPDLYRHMILTNVLLALGIPLVIACVTIRVIEARQKTDSPFFAFLGPKAPKP
jgi:hypothetical protein